MRLILCVVADIITLGGQVNDGYWRNGQMSYATRELHRLGVVRWWRGR